MRVIKDLKYNEWNALDIYAADKKDADTIVYFHGGGIESGDKSDSYYVEMAECFAREGYHFVSVNYRLYPRAKYPDYLTDCAEAVAFVENARKNRHEKGKLFIAGQSAGAWIATMLAVNEGLLKAVGIDNGKIDGWIIDSAQMTSHFNVIKHEKGLDPNLQRIDEFAPLYYVNKETAFSRMLLIFYERDMPCRPEQNLLFYKSILLFRSEADVSCICLPGQHCQGSTVKDENGEYSFVRATFKWLKEVKKL